MAKNTNRVTRIEARLPVGAILREWGTAVPGSVLGLLVLVLLFGGPLEYGVAGLHVGLLAMIGIAALGRTALPPRATGVVAMWLSLSDRVVLPLAAVSVVSAGLGADGDILYPLVLLLVLWAATTLPKEAMWLAVGYAVAASLGRYIGRGGWSGDLAPMLLRDAFVVAFAMGGTVLLRHEVRAARKRTEAEVRALHQRTEAEARSLGLSEVARAPEGARDLGQSVAQVRGAMEDTLALTRRAVGAHSAVLMTRASENELHVYAAVSPDIDAVTRDAVDQRMGILAALAHRAEAGDDPVVRVPKLEGRTAQLPYYVDTPARVQSVMAVPIHSEGGKLQGVLFYDRTAGEAFDDSDARRARIAGRLVTRILGTERTLLATEHRSQVLDQLTAASQKLTAAFGPTDVYRAVLESAHGLTPLRFGALVLVESATGHGRVADAIGEAGVHCVGKTVVPGGSLGGVALKTPAPLPPNRRWTAAHGSLLGSGLGPQLADGDPVLALPLAVHDTVVGALILVPKGPLSDEAARLLDLHARQAALMVDHAIALSDLETRATTDSLTSLDNRATVLLKLDQGVARCRRRGEEAAVLMIDIDHFKNVNDTHGHPAGDTVLRQVARVIDESRRAGDSVGRIGGEEFAMVLEGTGDAGARLVAERLRRKVASLQFPSSVKPFGVTLSVGFAIFERDGDDCPTLLKHADSALYQAKNDGRNQVRGFRDRAQQIAAAS